LEEVPFYLVTPIPFLLGPDFLDWLKAEILKLKLKLVVVDSYTALREARRGQDIVKIEQTDMLLLDQLGKETNCLIVIIHHGSKGSIPLDWTEQFAGTFAMSAAVESIIHISRFADLDSHAPERLVRVRGRHLRGTEFVLRFREALLDYEYVLESSAAALYPLITQLQRGSPRISG
jgi:RecA-family ATPase